MSTLVWCRVTGQHAPVHCAMQFHPHEAVDALKFHSEAFHAESNKRREIEGERLLPALVQQSVILDVVLIEVIRERIEAVPVVAALKKNSCGHQPGHSSVSIVKRVNGREEKVGYQRVDGRRETAKLAAIDESDVRIHQER